MTYLGIIKSFLKKKKLNSYELIYPNGNKKVKLICLTNAAFGTGSNTILDCTPLATPKKKPNLNMRKSSGFNKNLKMLTGCLKMTLVPQIDCD